MIEITNVYFEQVITPLFTELLQKKWHIKTAYALARITEKLQTEGKSYFQLKDQLIKKYGKKDGNGEIMITPKGQVELEDVINFNKEFQELQEIKITIDVPKADVNLDTGPDISVQEMLLLFPIINTS